MTGRMPAPGVCLLAALLGPLAGAPAANASTASEVLVSRCNDRDCRFSDLQTLIQYTAAPGETNVLTVALNATVTGFADTVTITPYGACTSVSRTEVSCDAGRLAPTAPSTLPIPSASLMLGDGDDSMAVNGIPAGPLDRVAGGGAFVLNVDGEAGNDTLAGGPERDALTGGDGADAVAGGDGDDRLLAAEVSPSSDSYDGGPGIDTIDYASRREKVTVRLGSGGGRAEDFIRDVEAVVGGLGADTISGDREDNSIDGGRGQDTLEGGGGNDEITDGPGRDVIRAGAGDDLLLPTADGQPDRWSCGSGVDLVQEPDAADVLARDCEGVDLYEIGDDVGPMKPYPTQLRGGRARFDVPCYFDRGCSGSVSVRRAGSKRPGPAARFNHPDSGTVRVWVTVPRNARRGLARVDVNALQRGDDAEEGQIAYQIHMP